MQRKDGETKEESVRDDRIGDLKLETRDKIGGKPGIRESSIAGTDKEQWDGPDPPDTS